MRVPGWLPGLCLLTAAVPVPASQGPAIGLPPHYLQPAPIEFHLPFDLAFNGGGLIDLAPQQVLLEFEVGREGSVESVQPQGSVPEHAALDTLLEAARKYRFPQKYVEWEARPYTTVVAFPLPSQGCWRPPMHESLQRGYSRPHN